MSRLRNIGLMIEFLTAPYPLQKDWKAHLAFILGTGLFVSVFLLTFQPFGTYEYQDPHKTFFLLGYGVVISGVMALVSCGVPTVLPGLFREEGWTVGKQIIWLAVLFMLAIAGCYGYKAWYFSERFSLYSMLNFFLIAFSTAIFPIAAIVVSDYIRLLRKYRKGVRQVPLVEGLPKEKELMLEGENQGEIIHLLPSQILFLKSSDNYVEVFYGEDAPQRRVLRAALKQMEKQLPKEGFVRCHRSFIVNLGRVVEVSGNAQGYKLHLRGVAETVPVARSKSEEVLSRLGTGA